MFKSIEKEFTIFHRCFRDGSIQFGDQVRCKQNETHEADHRPSTRLGGVLEELVGFICGYLSLFCLKKCFLQVHCLWIDARQSGAVQESLKKIINKLFRIFLNKDILSIHPHDRPEECEGGQELGKKSSKFTKIGGHTQDRSE